MDIRLIKSVACLIFIVFTAATFVLSQANLLQNRPAPQIPEKIFSPSNAKTESGGYIPTKDFIPASRCADCHKESHAEWSESLHRNSGREPFYKASVDLLEKSRGVEFIQHCESCHAPVSLFSGALVSGSKETREMDDEGITCSVCHSITDAEPTGTSSYTIRKPYLLLDENGNGIGAEAKNTDIIANIPDHKRAVMNPVIKKPEFCGACHKSNAPPELNNYKFIRGYSTYDEWQQSGASHQSPLPFYRADKPKDCRTCHMPQTESKFDAATKNGAIASHRWLGANTAVPLFYGQKKQAELTEKFLKNNVLSVDIFAVRNSSTNEIAAPLAQNGVNQIKTKNGEEMIADVVIFNRGAAHSFPPELRDLYEPWVEFEAIDKMNGKTIFHSGYVQPDGQVDGKAHVYKAILLDPTGKPFTRHEVWLGTAKAYDNFIPPGRSDLARYRFRLPENVETQNILLRAKVNYRRFLADYAEFVEKEFKNKMPNPTVEMAFSETILQSINSPAISNKTDNQSKKDKADKPKTVNAEIVAAEKAKGKNSNSEISKSDSESAKLLARRWNDYGIGLLGQSQYGEAAEAFRTASEIQPDNPDLLVNAAIAESQTERFGPEKIQLIKATALLEQALKIAPEHPRVRYFWGINRKNSNLPEAAAEIFATLAKEFPHDREIQRQFGQALYRLGKYDESQKAFAEIIRIDPTDAGAYQYMSPLFAAAGSTDQSKDAQQKYLLWRDDPLADVVANKFYAAHPEWADARVPGKIYSAESPERIINNGGAAGGGK